MSDALDLAALRPGQVCAVSDALCAVRTERGLFVLPRRCPHEGADLAYGWVDGGRLRCPAHHLPIDPETGTTPCRSLGTLPVRRLEPGADGRYRLPVDGAGNGAP